MTDTKAMTVRLPADLAHELEAVAAIDGQPIAEVVRVAVAAFIRKRKADPAFQLALAAWLMRLERLADSAAGDWPDDDPPARTSGTLPSRLRALEHHARP